MLTDPWRTDDISISTEMKKQNHRNTELSFKMGVVLQTSTYGSYEIANVVKRESMDEVACDIFELRQIGDGFCICQNRELNIFKMRNGCALAALAIIFIIELPCFRPKKFMEGFIIAQYSF